MDSSTIRIDHHHSADASSRVAVQSVSTDAVNDQQILDSIENSPASETNSPRDVNDDETQRPSAYQVLENRSTASTVYNSRPPSLVQDNDTLSIANSFATDENSAEDTSSSSTGVLESSNSDSESNNTRDSDPLMATAFRLGLHYLDAVTQTSEGETYAMNRFLDGSDDHWTPELVPVESGACTIISEQPLFLDGVSPSEKIPSCYKDTAGNFSMYAFLRRNDYPWRLLNRNGRGQRA